MPSKGQNCPRCGDITTGDTNLYKCQKCGATGFGICCGYSFNKCDSCGKLVCLDCSGYHGHGHQCSDCTPDYMKGHEFDK